MPDIVIVRPDAEAIQQEYSPLVAQATALQVANIGDHEVALECLKQLRGAAKRVKERLEPIIESAHKAHKGLTTLRADLLRPIETADRIVSGKCSAYEAEQRRIADELRRRAEEEARKREEERQLMEAIEAEEAGDKDAAEALLDEPIQVPTIQVAPETAKVAGVSSRQTWRAEVTDLKALIVYVAQHPEWTHLLEPSMTALNGLARSQQAALVIPGIRAVAETVRSVRTA